MGGTYIEPTILTDVPHNVLVARGETFGPLAPLFKFTDEAEVVALAYDTDSGLAAYFYTRDLSRIFRVAETLNVEIKYLNLAFSST